MLKREFVFYYFRRDNPCQEIFYNTEVTGVPRECTSWKELEDIKKNDPDISGIGCSDLGPEGLNGDAIKDMLFEVNEI